MTREPANQLGLPYPTLFISHGAPDILLASHPYLDALAQFTKELPQPKAIVVISAHWLQTPIGITAAKHPEILYDFSGFPRELYSISYPAVGDPELAKQISDLLKQHGIEQQPSDTHGLDHGAWVPLKLMYPKADIPVVQVSLPASSLEVCIKLGKALAPLREQGVLIFGSGGSVHNLRAIRSDGQTDDWALEFEDWLLQCIENNHVHHLANPEGWPDSFAKAHPTLEHFAPLLVAWSAGNGDQAGYRFHHSFTYGNLGMSCFQFGNRP